LYFDKALAINPYYVSALNNKGIALYDLGNYTGATQYYNKALTQDPNYVNALNNKGNALAKLSRHHGALQIYNKPSGIGSNKTGVLLQSYNVPRHFTIFEVSYIP
jgi:tetratricopeptide (TPR) repeat protein